MDILVCDYMDILVCCMNDHTSLPTATWLYSEIKAASHNEVCRCERQYSVVFRFPGCFWENAISCYLTLHHQTHISISWEREWWQSPHFTFHRNQAVRGPLLFHSSEIFEFITKLISGRCGQEATAGGRYSVPVMLIYKKIWTTLQWGWIVTFYSVTFSPGRSPG